MNNKNEISQVAVDALRPLGRLAFEGLGLAPNAAEQVAKVLVLADLFGLTTHGLSRIESYGARLESGGISAAAEPTIEPLAPAVARIDGRNAVGPLVGMAALEAGMDIARQFGISLVLARGSNHFGPVSPYSYLAAEQGFASIIGSNATTTIAPSGGSDARLGNSPLGFGVPNPDGNHFMLDMAMSVVARAKIRNALKRGESIPDSWATDASGKPTTDPAAALDGFLLPIGGHKGYGLALVVDLLAGLLSDAAYLTHVKSWVDAPDEPQNLGHFFILIDTARLGSVEWLKGRMIDFAAILHQSPAVDSGSPVIVPGEIELRKMQRYLQEGVPVDPATKALLDQYASRTA
ncbi:Ldh family oxidoreductase [Pseudomonas sp. RGM2987]|uniref:Ldh family oxidoreductase n=1 Tax=Pseudomonas sp. RGM2987 TaxID=2930090 RepID=UPI001FD63CF1|nr:Ldh family oxidoreductase [Pseudomonas sp. RGM2987]MCJ8203468.1 Ldh family oxidoreductase [Pseudomonas sp. RGM2987]